MATPAAPDPRRSRRIGALLVAAVMALAVAVPAPSVAAGGLEVSFISELAATVDDVDDVVIELA